MEDDAISNFCAITGATPDQARFFLESSGNDMEQAMSAFYDQDGEDDLPAEEGVPSDSVRGPVPPAPVQQEQAGGVRQGQGAWPGASGGGGAGPSIRGGEVRGGGKRRPAGTGAGGGGIRTLGDLGKAAEQDDSDEEDGPQEYYTGGEKSGMMVQDPSKKPGSSVDSIFDRARQHGAVDGTPADMLPSAPAARGAFTGAARTLGADGSPAVPEAPAAAAAPERAVHTITFWRNGFTVDEGPLRRLEDPANAPFLNSINKGECPRELAPADARVMVHVNLVRKDADYEPPKEPKYRAFVGSGRTLGTTDGTPPPEPAASAPATASSNKSFEVDESQPFTSLQLRLLDGTRLVARFNHSHTVGDIRRFLERARPGATSAYHLVTSFPPRTLTDFDQTIEQAGLMNAVVMQKA